MRRHSEIRDLISFAIDLLPKMQLPSSLFCYERIKGQTTPRGISARYTLITLLGMLEAIKAGYRVPFDLNKIWDASFSRIDSSEITAGDIGLYLWVDSELKGENIAGLLKKLEGMFKTRDGLTGCMGMEIAWIATGLASAVRKSGSSEAARLLKTVLGCIQTLCTARHGLLHHYNKTHPRRRFPNFANQIYNIYALTCAADTLGSDQLLTEARKAADKLLALQLPCGGWPWLYDSEHGIIVERYEIYSVHQDGMAPMALLKLAHLTGDAKYLQAASKSLDWLYSKNELKVPMIDEKEGLIYRSIRRRKPFDKLMLVSNTALSLWGFTSDCANGRFLEINPTCRPYHLGWLLYAWSGQESSFNDMLDL